jgi:formylglycine-generating enzyme required for sulfatase activity
VLLKTRSKLKKVTEAQQKTQNSQAKIPSVKTINGIECVLVKAGTFMMGSPTSENGRDSNELQHQVTITKDFWISKYEVTQEQYKAVMGTNPSYFEGNNLPVEKVNYHDALIFCQKVGGRLPTEAEWEFAARGGKNSKGYIYSGSNSLGTVGWNGYNSNGTKTVGTRAPNELGIYDMSGNVWEWCSDWYGDYSSSPVSDPTGPESGSARVFRGGSWFRESQYCRVANRDYDSPSNRGCSLGLRVVFDKN